MADSKQYWIIKGEVTDPDAHEGATVGDVEWQFSDGPAGERGSSADFLSLEEGLAHFSGAVFHFEQAADEIRDVTLPWHGMMCPGCLSTSDLRVSFSGFADLTPYGSEDAGDHEWDETSSCTCTSCGVSYPAKVFQMGDEGDVIGVPMRDTYGTGHPDDLSPDVQLDVTIVGMVTDEEGNAVVAESIGALATTYDVYVLRRIGTRLDYLATSEGHRTGRSAEDKAQVFRRKFLVG